MLVPALRAVGAHVVVAQTRGRDFADACAQASGAYEVDVFRADGSTETDIVEVEGGRECVCTHWVAVGD